MSKVSREAGGDSAPEAAANASPGTMAGVTSDTAMVTALKPASGPTPDVTRPAPRPGAEDVPQAATRAPEVGDSLLLKLDGFEGPLDLLLDLARAQKVDLAKISILSLVDQYLAVIEGARTVRLELAAEWLVMAAWLTWLKSRLLVPAGEDDAEDPEQAAELLTGRLQALELIRAAAAWLGRRPILGTDVFGSGEREDHTIIDRSRLVIDQTAFLSAYLRAVRRGTKVVAYQPRHLSWFTVKDALQRLSMLMGSMPDWTSLERFLPDSARANPLQRRAAMSSTLIAGLELARGGQLQLRQDEAFGPILVGRGTMMEGPAEGDRTHGDLT